MLPSCPRAGASPVVVPVVPFRGTPSQQHARRHQRSSTRAHGLLSASEAKAAPHLTPRYTPLAVYPWETDRSGRQFNAAVSELLCNVSDHPLLQLTYSRRSSTIHQQHAVPDDLVGNPEAWVRFARQLSGPAAAPSQLMFIHPVDSPCHFCGRCTPTNASGRAACSHEDCAFAREQRCSFEGKVGDDCCDRAHSEEERTAQQILHTPDHLLGRKGRYSSVVDGRSFEVQYYGLVAQSRQRAATDGCYLVKTVKQLAAAACHCTHFSVMRACQDGSMHQQALDFWL